MDPESPKSNPEKPKDQARPHGLGTFWAELKRRKVMRVAITYAVVAWLLIQISATVFPQLGMPEWTPRLVTLLLLIGFPVALILTWAFELTPDGIKTTQHAREDRGDTPVSKQQQRKRNWFSVVFAAAIPTLIFGTLAIFFYIQKLPLPPGLSKVEWPGPPAPRPFKSKTWTNPSPSSPSKI